MASVPGMHEYDFDEVIEMNSVEVSDATTLVFEIVWQRQRRAASVGGGAVREETVGWASVPFIDGKSGRALHGSHTLDVHRLPLLLDGALGARLPFDGAKLDFAVDVSPVEDSDDESDDADGEGGDGAALGHDDELPEESAEDVPGVPRAAWMHVGQPSPQNRPFQLGESFVIYVDGLRFAPRNATVVQVTACVMSTSFDRLTPLSRSVARMGSSALHPELGMRVVVQTSEWPDDMPQASLLIQMETIERPSVLHPADRHSSPCVIGYAAINLFVSRESAEDFEARAPPEELFRMASSSASPYTLTRNETTMMTTRMHRSAPRAGVQEARQRRSARPTPERLWHERGGARPLRVGRRGVGDRGRPNPHHRLSPFAPH